MLVLRERDFAEFKFTILDWFALLLQTPVVDYYANDHRIFVRRIRNEPRNDTRVQSRNWQDKNTIRVGLTSRWSMIFGGGIGGTQKT